MSIARLIGLLAVSVFLHSSVPGALARVDDPNKYSGDPNAHKAYKAAQAHSKVFKQLFCYCGCDKDGYDHKNLLDCFRDEHGAGCGICKSEAIMADNMLKSKAPVASVRKSIDSSFGGTYKGPPSAAYRAYKSKSKSM